MESGIDKFQSQMIAKASTLRCRKFIVSFLHVFPLPEQHGFLPWQHRLRRSATGKRTGPWPQNLGKSSMKLEGWPHPKVVFILFYICFFNGEIRQEVRFPDLVTLNAFSGVDGMWELICWYTSIYIHTNLQYLTITMSSCYIYDYIYIYHIYISIYL